MLIVVISAGEGIVTNLVDTFLFLTNVDSSGDIKEKGIVNDLQVQLARLPVGKIALRIMILF